MYEFDRYRTRDDLDADIEWMKAYSYVSCEPDISTNKTYVTVTVRAIYNPSYSVGYTRHGYISVGGIKKVIPDEEKTNVPFKKGELVDVWEDTFEVPHDNDGSKTATVEICIGISPSFLLGYISDKRDFVLQDIPVDTDLDSASDTLLGEYCTLKWTPLNEDLKYKLKFSLNEWSVETGFIEPGINTEYEYTYQIPIEAANQIPASEIGAMSANLYTYTADDRLVGVPSVRTFLVSVPSSAVPNMLSASMTLVNDIEWLRENNLAFVGYTKLNIAASASGIYGSTISRFELSGAYNESAYSTDGANLDFTGRELTSPGLIGVKIVAVDSRGRKSSAFELSGDICCAYSKPIITDLKIIRTTEDEISVTPVWTFSDIEGNSVSSILEYKRPSESAWSVAGSVSATGTLFYNFQDTKTYNFRLTITDKVGNSSVREVYLPTTEVLLDFPIGGQGLGVGKICENNALEVDFDAEFYGGISLYVESLKRLQTLDEYILSFIPDIPAVVDQNVTNRLANIVNEVIAALPNGDEVSY